MNYLPPFSREIKTSCLLSANSRHGSQLRSPPTKALRKPPNVLFPAFFSRDQNLLLAVRKFPPWLPNPLPTYQSPNESHPMYFCTLFSREIKTLSKSESSAVEMQALGLWAVCRRPPLFVHVSAGLPSSVEAQQQLQVSTRRKWQLPALSGPGGNNPETEEGAKLLAEFMQYVESSQQSWPLEGRKPSHLMPPTTVVRVQMEALMRNEWPDEDSGIRTAFAFAMPARADDMLPGQIRPPVAAARAWDAVERYLSLEEFGKLLRQPMYASIINCTHWEMVSPMVFHGPGNVRALQAVRVKYQAHDGSEKSRVYTFCLEKVAAGAYKDCWMVVGTRLGDYANV